MSSYKLGVEVVSAHDLMPKDAQGSSSPFVELQFSGQRFRTTTKERNLNPVWNERFHFNIPNLGSLPQLALEASVYSMSKASQPRSFLGKVSISGTTFVPYADAVVTQHPLEKRGMFSRVKGELRLKVFLTVDPSPNSSDPVPKADAPSQASQAAAKEVGQKKQSSAPAKEQQNPKVVMFSSSAPSQQPLDYALKETRPLLGRGADKPATTYDLVEQMQYLFVRVVKARDLPSGDAKGSVEVRVGDYKGTTKQFEKQQNPAWNEVFAFSKERMEAPVLEVVVVVNGKDDPVGVVRFDLTDVPTRVPPNGPLAPEWYRLDDKKGEKTKGELMLAVWFGTQADESFPEAGLPDATAPVDASHIRSKVYHAPRLWYVRVNVIEAQDIVMADKSRFPDVYVKAQVGNQESRTSTVATRAHNPIWNEDLMFVAAEPFDDDLILSVRDSVAPNKDEVIGSAIVPLGSVEKRLDDGIIHGRWFNLEKPQQKKNKDKDKISCRIHLRLCLEGGYHVLDESASCSSDLRPTAKQLWKPPVGLLELGILNAMGIHPMKTREGKGTSDTYCVAKYGHIWVRTRTVLNSLFPRYNEQYMWEVFDPDTVLTIGVFDNCHLGEKGSNGNKEDAMVGKIRIRLSTLETGRVYTHSYPLLVLQPSGLKKMGELQLAIRFSTTSLVSMMCMYAQPLLPSMHYVRPLTGMQREFLRRQAIQVVAARLSRTEPPLRKEVVEYMCDVDSHKWSMRRSKANYHRLLSVVAAAADGIKWFGDVCAWKNPITTSVVHLLFLLLVCFPDLILTAMFMYLFLVGICNYRYRPRHPPHMNTQLSYAEAAIPDEIEEEFDTYPTGGKPEAVRMRYDRLRGVAANVQTVLGELASQGERVQALLSWRDPRATVMFVVFCLVAALVLYTTSLQVLATFAGLYLMRHPKFRGRVPPAPVNFFVRLPTRADCMI
ncbi:FT-interacting protein 3-like [Musa acuminata AAA Group]|uniref:FT-interacting protein 3-like n=1 Tax=Musa acuminata AAA Group TaxID=214697 RepID=UPI0031D3D703